MRRAFKALYSTVSENITKSKMPPRYFKNALLDSQEGQVPTISEDEVKAAIVKILESIDSNIDASESSDDSGLYVGTSGIAYMFYYLAKQPQFSQYSQSYLYKAETYLTKSLEAIRTVSVEDLGAFLVGNCGVNAVASAYYNYIGNNDLASTYRRAYYTGANALKEKAFDKRGADELFVGRAGFVAGALWMAKETNTDFHKKDVYDLCDCMVQSGRDLSQKWAHRSPLMYQYYNVSYVGAAHGLSSILQVLMSVPGYLENRPQESIDVKGSVDYLLSLQDPEGNFPSETTEHRSQNELVHWCHGAPGVIYTMAKAYLVFKEEQYLKSCHDAANHIWRKGLLKKGPGICHGVAGNAYAFLLMYRLTGDSQWLNKAASFAKFMQSDEFKKNARVPDCPYSLYEGIAGTACFLMDLIAPQKAAFPFMDVF